MSTILAVESSADCASIALVLGESVFLRETRGVATHSQSLLPMVQAVLLDAGLRIADCDAIGVGIGPGSFTGVRSACGIAQGLAAAQGLPVVPVVTQTAMAERARRLFGCSRVWTLIDARMGEIYAAQWTWDDEWRALTPPCLRRPEQLCLPKDVPAVGNAAGIAGAYAEVMPHAQEVAMIAQRALARGESVAASAAQPLYLRNKVAQTTAERLAARADKEAR